MEMKLNSLGFDFINHMLLSSMELELGLQNCTFEDGSIPVEEGVQKDGWRMLCGPLDFYFFLN